MNPKISTSTHKKLAAYSSAAGVGAFSLSMADAAIVHQSTLDGFAPVTLVNGSPNLLLDVDGDSDTDIEFAVFTTPTETARVFEIGTSSALSPSDTANTYVFGFEQNELIDSSALDKNDVINDVSRINGNIGAWSTGYGGYLNNFVGEGYLGIEFNNAATGNTHFGWVQVELSSPVASELQLDILGYAWEDVAGVGIAAGAIPEPSTYALGLGLLALGAAGIRARRKA